MVAQVVKRLLTTDEFHRMGEAGILGGEDRLELVDGEILRMTPIGSRHAACVRRITALFAKRLGTRVSVSIQNPVVLGKHIELQPDVALLRPRPDAYAQQHPNGSDVLLIVEVVDSSGEHDRGTKLPAYARARVCEVWLVDLPQEKIEIYRSPMLRAYRDRSEVGRGQRLCAQAFPRTTFRANEVLG